MENIVQLSGITKVYSQGSWLRGRQNFYALENIDLDIRRGEILGILGESGSGKSTLAKVLTRIEQADKGQLSLNGKVLKGQGKSRAERLDYGSQVQMIFQDPFGSLNPVHTVAYHIERPLCLHHRNPTLSAEELRQKSIEVMEAVGLRPAASYLQKFPFELSGGQRQRVAIARALAAEPTLLIADEPTSMLDVSIRMDILNLIKNLREQRGLTIVLITHDLPSAWYLTDRVAVVYAGQVLELGPTQEVLARPAHPYTQLLLQVSQQKILRRSKKTREEGQSAAQLRTLPGCLFAPRCPRAEATCRAKAPELAPLASERTARCFFPFQEPAQDKERFDA